MPQSPPSPSNPRPVKSWQDQKSMLPDYEDLREILINREDYTVYTQKFLEDALPDPPGFSSSENVEQGSPVDTKDELA